MSLRLIFALLLISTAHADEVLEEIEVSASKDIGRYTFGSSSEISERQLETSATGLIAPAIEKTPGLVSSQNGGPGGRVSFFIRGTESRHVSFTLDGLKINDTSNVDRQFDAAFMTSAFLSGVTVHRGPQAVLYGSDAMGGIVELRTRKGSDNPETRFLLNGGSFGTVDATLSSDWGNKKNRGTLTVTQFHTDGISRLNEKRFGATEADSADITQLTSSSEHNWAEKWKTELLASYIHGKNEFDDFSQDTSKNKGESDQYIIQQKTSYQLKKNSAISLRNGLSRHQRFLKSLAFGGGIDEDTFGGNLYQNELLHRYDTNKLSLLSGVSNEHEETHTQTIDKSFDLNSLFLQSAYDFHGLKLQAGGRADHHSRYGEFLTGSAGVAHNIGKNRLSVQYSQGFKAPSLYQLYAPFSFGQNIGNENLVPERNHSWEASWLFMQEAWETEITFFQNRLSNLITFSNAGYMNQGSFIAEGVEFSGKWKSEKFEIAPSYTYQEFKEEERKILGRPYNIGKISVSYFPVESIEINATERWFSSRWSVDTMGNNVKLNGFGVLDIGIRKTWEKDDVGLQFKNVLDREYEELYGYSVLPFSVFAHYGHRF